MKPQFDLPCVILCGGKSSRMKEDKSLLPFANETSLAKYQYNRLKPYFKKIYLSCKNNKFDFEADLIIEENDIYSPIVGLNTIFNKLEDDKIFIITVDTPLVQISSIKSLIDQSIGFDVTVPRTERTHSLCGVFSSNIISLTKKMLDDDFHKVGYLLNNLNTKIIDFFNDDEFINLNKPEDYKKALTLINKA
ncbi:molybdenum cofactor guanylyltransferase MobA [Arcobacter sp. CECT 8985]|uniref:molybdenum cofactor guanylyltransferase MobA n=1 Tax=Arcobacter sp. CECT 8985 TaxID=1935424 RepID=UPI00100C1E35|nr:molybdenum cofactor guanylyltransferase MobA [Arcobacter sp. CECT 8985]RXJ85614.1 molybdenum cofactor guanylyltransferase [Arcobacter sp. CECT 8985]